MTATERVFYAVNQWALAKRCKAAGPEVRGGTDAEIMRWYTELEQALAQWAEDQRIPTQSQVLVPRVTVIDTGCPTVVPELHGEQKLLKVIREGLPALMPGDIAEPCNEGVIMRVVNPDWPGGTGPFVETDECPDCGGVGCARQHGV